MKKESKNGFTLVELLAVIVILSIILVIAVPKVINVIEDSKKATLELTAKMIASTAEKVKVQNDLLGKTEELECESVAKINDIDYADCDIEFKDDTAYVTIIGSGKFDNLYVCNGTKTSANATSEECPILYGDGDTYITKLLAKESELHNGLVQTTVEYNGIQYNAGIRYAGPLEGKNAVKNQVYFNCEDEYTSDSKTIKYGDEDYVYKDHCEVWRIIGVFNTKSNERDTTGIPRIKIININSTFQASWDSSASSINRGYGVNQWGEIKDSNGTIIYSGADLMQLLNGYYIEKNDSKISSLSKKECEYNNNNGQEGFEQTCDTIDAPLSDLKMKPLTSKALEMIDKAIWYTYAVKRPSSGSANSSWASIAYLEENGISKQYTGISECTGCSDGVIRTTSWKGLIGLMSISDMTYANGWLYNEIIYPWTITPASDSSFSSGVWNSGALNAYNDNAYFDYGVWPATYLVPDVQIVGGNGTEGNAYILNIEK